MFQTSIQSLGRYTLLQNVPNYYNDQNFETFETRFLIGETSENGGALEFKDIFSSEGNDKEEMGGCETKAM